MIKFVQSPVFKYILIFITAGIVLWVAFGFAFKYAVVQAAKKYPQKYGLEFSATKVEKNTLLSFTIFNAVLTNEAADTVFISDSIFISLRLGGLLKGNIRLRHFKINNSFVKIPDTTTDTIPPLPGAYSSKPASNTSYAKQLNAVTRYVYSFLPRTFEIRNFNLQYSSNNSQVAITVPFLNFYKNKLSGKIISSDTRGTHTCQIAGTFDAKNKQFEVYCSAENGMYQLPYLPQNPNTGLLFRSLYITSLARNNGNTEMFLRSFLEADSLLLFNERIGPDTIKVQHVTSEILMRAGHHYIEIDSSSYVALNTFEVPFYFHYQNTNSNFIFKIPAFTFSAPAMFAAMPGGLFKSVRTMVTEGHLSYSLNLNIKLNEPDSIYFRSGLTPKGFKLLKPGLANVYMLNDTFVHEIFENGNLEKIITVGEYSDKYLMLNEISDYLKYAVLTAEDGGFFYHKGFHEEALQKAIADNLKEKRFVRGGSTISMQLVKNIFLSRNKNIERKLEEILLVWIIENQRLVSKERMFEIYLNIIEWGPQIYGISEAAEFYFNKKASELNLAESIFLSAIIPGPKRFRYSFNENGQLKSVYATYYKNVSEIMLRREQIMPSDTINLKAEVFLSARALQHVLQPGGANDELNEMDKLLYFEE